MHPAPVLVQHRLRAAQTPKRKKKIFFPHFQTSPGESLLKRLPRTSPFLLRCHNTEHKQLETLCNQIWYALVWCQCFLRPTSMVGIAPGELAASSRGGVIHSYQPAWGQTLCLLKHLWALPNWWDTGSDHLCLEHPLWGVNLGLWHMMLFFPVGKRWARGCCQGAKGRNLSKPNAIRRAATRQSLAARNSSAPALSGLKWVLLTREGNNSALWGWTFSTGK